MPTVELIPMFISNILQTHFSEDEAAKDSFFAENEVYQGKVNDVLYVNQKTFKHLYEKFETPYLEQEIPQKFFDSNSLVQVFEIAYPNTAKLVSCIHKRVKSLPPENVIEVDPCHYIGLDYVEFMIAICFAAKELIKQKGAKIDELVTTLIAKLCVMHDLQMEYPPELEQIEQEFSDDTNYLSDPERGFSQSQSLIDAEIKRVEDAKLAIQRAKEEREQQALDLEN